VRQLGLPLFVKPATEGSSIGVTKVTRAEDLRAAYEAAAQFDKLVLCERFVAGREVQFPVLGDRVLPSIRVETPCEFYDYQAKYFRDDTVYHCPGLPEDEERALAETVLKSFRVLGCSGWGRVDLILAEDGTPYFLEVNTAPGMTSHSLVPMSARAVGIDFPDLCMQVLELAHVG
jgi:D-alanine-D-alanine ligase